VKPSAQARTIPLPWSHNPHVSPHAWRLDGGGYIERHGDGFLARVPGRELGFFRSMAAAATAVENAMGGK
jgi:hypothetical protein